MLNLAMIKEAQKRLTPYVYQTPLIRLRNLDSYLGCQVYVKAECMQLTNSFKSEEPSIRLCSLHLRNCKTVSSPPPAATTARE
jgi:threonine dehydratase